jgi:hypothetical protein
VLLEFSAAANQEAADDLEFTEELIQEHMVVEQLLESVPRIALSRVSRRKVRRDSAHLGSQRSQAQGLRKTEHQAPGRVEPPMSSTSLATRMTFSV